MAQCGENMCLCSYSFRFPAFPNLEQRLGNPAFLWNLEKELAFRNLRAKVSSLESDCQGSFRLIVLRFSFGQGSTLKLWPLLLAWDPVLTLHKNTIIAFDLMPLGNWARLGRHGFQDWMSYSSAWGLGESASLSLSFLSGEMDTVVTHKSFTFYGLCETLLWQLYDTQFGTAYFSP